MWDSCFEAPQAILFAYSLPEHEFSKAKSVMNGSDLLKFPPAALSIFRAILVKRPYRNFGFKWFAHPLSKFRLPSRACARNGKAARPQVCVSDYMKSGEWRIEARLAAYGPVWTYGTQYFKKKSASGGK